MRKLDAAWKVTDEAKTNGIELSLKVDLLNPPPIEALVPPVETAENKEWLKKKRDSLAAHEMCSHQKRLPSKSIQHNDSRFLLAGLTYGSR